MNLLEDTSNQRRLNVSIKNPNIQGYDQIITKDYVQVLNLLSCNNSCILYSLESNIKKKEKIIFSTLRHKLFTINLTLLNNFILMYFYI